MHIRQGFSTSRALSRNLWFSLFALTLAVLLAACGGSSGSTGTTPTASTGGTTPTATSSGSANSVTITNNGGFAFSPATLTVKVGTTVTWTNTTGTPHTVTSDDGKTFDSGITNPIPASGGTFKFTFNTPGTYSYHCQIHPSMMATIIVQ